MTHEDENVNPDHDVPEDETAAGRRRTRLAQLARRDVAAALLALEAVMEDYDANNTLCLFAVEDSETGVIIDEISEVNESALLGAHAVLMTMRRRLSHYLKDRA